MVNRLRLRLGGAPPRLLAGSPSGRPASHGSRRRPPPGRGQPPALRPRPHPHPAGPPPTSGRRPPRRPLLPARDRISTSSRRPGGPARLRPSAAATPVGRPRPHPAGAPGPLLGGALGFRLRRQRGLRPDGDRLGPVGSPSMLLGWRRCREPDWLAAFPRRPGTSARASSFAGRRPNGSPRPRLGAPPRPAPRRPPT